MITVNGKTESFTGPISLTDFLAQASYQPARIAVELNGAIIPKAEYDTTIITDGAVIEVVSFVGGG